MSGKALRGMMIRFVKIKYFGRAKLVHFQGSFFETGCSEIDPSRDTTVEAIVDDLVRLQMRKSLAESGKAR